MSRSNDPETAYGNCPGSARCPRLNLYRQLRTRFRHYAKRIGAVFGRAGHYSPWPELKPVWPGVVNEVTS